LYPYVLRSDLIEATHVPHHNPTPTLINRQASRCTPGTDREGFGEPATTMASGSPGAGGGDAVAAGRQRILERIDQTLAQMVNQGRLVVDFSKDESGKPRVFTTLRDVVTEVQAACGISYQRDNEYADRIRDGVRGLLGGRGVVYQQCFRCSKEQPPRRRVFKHLRLVPGAPPPPAASAQPTLFPLGAAGASSGAGGVAEAASMAVDRTAAYAGAAGFEVREGLGVLFCVVGASWVLLRGEETMI
jgi:hypothetical protein